MDRDACRVLIVSKALARSFVFKKLSRGTDLISMTEMRQRWRVLELTLEGSSRVTRVSSSESFRSTCLAGSIIATFTPEPDLNVPPRWKPGISAKKRFVWIKELEDQTDGGPKDVPHTSLLPKPVADISAPNCGKRSRASQIALASDPGRIAIRTERTYCARGQ
jgi:hypothetical protein